MEERQFVLDFIKKHKIGVIASVNSEGKPQDAVVGFGETDEFELIIGTFNTSRKYKNIKNNPNIAFVIGWDEYKTVQYEGSAEELSGEEKEKYKNIYFTKSPGVKKFESHPEQTYFKITPKWVRYTDLTQDPWKIIELNFKKNKKSPPFGRGL